MSSKKSRITLSVIALLIILMASGAFWAWNLFTSPTFLKGEQAHLYISSGSTSSQVLATMDTLASPMKIKALKAILDLRHYDQNVRSGHYVIDSSSSVLDVFRKLSRGEQTPVKVTIRPARTLQAVSNDLGRQLMADSTDILKVLTDSEWPKSLGLDESQSFSTVIPDTYEMYWNISVEKLCDRLSQEYNRFWKSKEEKVKALGLSPSEISVLASIVEEETQSSKEKPVVAGLYLNRLHRGMPLQADPTVLFGMGLLGKAHRVTNEYLRHESPFNTYLHQGLPPSPIRIPSKEGLEAVLDYAHHDYLYMCAKEDFSGTHNFARTLSEHNRNADRYRAALNQRKIYN